MAAPSEIRDLTARFELHHDAYRSGRYNETQLRREFLDPFFEALGWDVNNTQGYAEAYKDVIHEDAIKVGGATKAPDYCFRIGGVRKFFVEAKKPSVDVKGDSVPAFQLRRYAWSARLPLSILTDFEEFAVYDCRIRPAKTDPASTGRTLFCAFAEYADRWDEIASIFARDAVLKGSFDKYAESTKAKRGTAEVDSAFLAEIESWREILAHNIALRNPRLSRRELNFAVQRTIDRIIFLRMAEDRGIEEYATLQTILSGTNIYGRLVELFYRADQRYNSGLFHFESEKDRTEPDTLTPKLKVDDKPLKEIIRRLYYPDCPYEFSVLPADILGQVYEQFLGKVIRLTAGHRAVVEDKPEVKKAGGVYYTPTYIVEYIVANTLGRLLADLPVPGPVTSVGTTRRVARGRGTASPLRTPKEVASLRILDPACGSGSFLIVAYQRLLDWHRDWYVNDGPEKHAKGRRPALYQASGGEWRLTTAERKRILLNNIYGVDIDSQAVEVTKLSLLLKVLEGESEQSLTNQLKWLRERALPDLASNIKCGNSLIGPDFYEGRQIDFLDEEERYRINVFDWDAEFPGIMQDGGFDVVIGNPPYIRIQALKEWAPVEVEFYKSEYTAASKGNYDIYVVFVERGLSLLNSRGRLGFILPHKFFNAKYGEPLRGLLAQGKHVSQIVHFGHQQVFAGATTYTCLLFADKAGTKNVRIAKVSDLSSWRITGDAEEGTTASAGITTAEWNFVVGRAGSLFDRLRDMPTKLTHVVDRMAQGIRTSANDIFVLDAISERKGVVTAYSRHLEREVTLDRGSLSHFLLGREIKRYRVTPSGKVVILPYRTDANHARLIPVENMRADFPNTFEYLLSLRSDLERRERGRMRGQNWYGYVYPKNIEIMRAPKILIPDIARGASYALDADGEYAFASGYGLTLRAESTGDTRLILGLLNSRLLDFYLKRISTVMRGGFVRFFTQYLEQLPIPSPGDNGHGRRTRRASIIGHVDDMLALNEQVAAAKTEHAKNTIQRQIDATDTQIDNLVYELYGLTDEEVRMVEEETGGKKSMKTAALTTRPHNP